MERADACAFDRLEIYDGGSDSAPLLRVLCGFGIPKVVKSTGNSLLVKFLSDKMDTKNGFAIKYTPVISKITYLFTYSLTNLVTNDLLTYKLIILQTYLLTNLHTYLLTY